MRIVRLTPEDAERINALAERHYKSELALSKDEIEENLKTAESEEGNFSFGLEENRELVGYLLAWLEESRIEGRKESVVLVDDLVVEPHARHGTKELIRSMVCELQDREKGQLAVEAALLENVKDTFAQPRKFFESLGYELAAQIDYEDEDLQQSMTWVRYEPW